MSNENYTNEKQNIAIAELKKDVGFLKSEITEIKNQVKNHIPSEIKEMGHRICELKKVFQEYQLSEAKWKIGILVAIILLLGGVIANIIISLVK